MTIESGSALPSDILRIVLNEERFRLAIVREPDIEKNTLLAQLVRTDPMRVSRHVLDLVQTILSEINGSDTTPNRQDRRDASLVVLDALKIPTLYHGRLTAPLARIPSSNLFPAYIDAVSALDPDTHDPLGAPISLADAGVAIAPFFVPDENMGRTFAVGRIGEAWNRYTTRLMAPGHTLRMLRQQLDRVVAAFPS